MIGEKEVHDANQEKGQAKIDTEKDHKFQERMKPRVKPQALPTGLPIPFRCNNETVKYSKKNEQGSEKKKGGANGHCYENKSGRF